MFFVISLTLLINGNNVVINLVPGLEWLIPGLEGLFVQLGLVVQICWAYAIRVCCMVLFNID